jgi:hypothetical protein
MRCLAALILTLLAFGAQAQQRQYAVLSLVGDQLLIVKREMSTGSRIDRNERTAIPLPDAGLDRAVLLAVDEALRKLDPAARPVLLSTRDPALYAAAARSLDSGGTQRLFDAVLPVVAKANATHLLLVTKHRGPAMLRVTGGHVGTGFLEGMGFYLDHGTGETSVLATDTERGFISSFTYFKVSLIDLAQGRVVAEEHAIGSNAHVLPGGQIGNAWTALTPQEKDQQLGDLIRDETARAIPRLLKGVRLN